MVFQNPAELIPSDYKKLAQYHFERNSNLQSRSISNLEADINAVRCLAQAAINVELFTIPLYMTTMYSIKGMHKITEARPEDKKNDKHYKGLYYGRLWPGLSPTPNPKTENEKAFNIIFSVFIQEMLHLQMASNIYNALSNAPEGMPKAAKPTFTSDLLVNAQNGWTCYGENKTEIPHILDLKDLKSSASSIKVRLGALDENNIDLFLLIEQPSEDLKKDIKDDAKHKYIATQEGGVLNAVPFANWSATSKEQDLPAFGTIATMYECLAAYLNVTYDDGSSLFKHILDTSSIQRDLFNIKEKGHPMAEFPEMETVLDVTGKTGSELYNTAKDQIFSMMNGITDQGEGSTMAVDPDPVLLTAVQDKYQPSFESLKEDYIQYDETGNPLPVSGSAHARAINGVDDHFERFMEVKALLKAKKIETWADWHKSSDARWTSEMLKDTGYDDNPHNASLPKAEEIATALNNLKAEHQKNKPIMSHVAAGAIAGITTVLNKYWTDEDVDFPFPSMSGSGDRISIYWAIFGEAPNLATGEYPRIPEKNRHFLYHACQGMALTDVPDEDKNACASKPVFHTCRGSNSCKTEGGCGFVQSVSGGGSGCRSLGNVKKLSAGCGAPTLYSPPADNKCATYGGCAVPISASQLYPDSGVMPVYKFGDDFTPERIENQGINFEVGDPVYKVAWDAYTLAMEAEGKTVPEKPEVSDLRLAFPPST